MAELKGKTRRLRPRHPERDAVPRPCSSAPAPPARRVIELPIGQHVAALVAGPGRRRATRSSRPAPIGRMNGTTRVLEAGVVAKYILGDPMAPWHGGSASLTTEFIKKYPERDEEVHRRLRARRRAGAHQAGRGAPVHEGLHRHRRPADRRGAAGLVHALQRVQAERRRVLPEVLRPVHREGHLREAGRSSSRCSTRA